MKQLKDVIIDGMVEKMKLPRNVIEAVVMDQFQNVSKALLTETSVEISGFGVFYFLPNKAAKMLEVLKKADSGEKALNIKKEAEALKNDIALIENQLNKCLKLNK